MSAYRTISNWNVGLFDVTSSSNPFVDLMESQYFRRTKVEEVVFANTDYLSKKSIDLIGQHGLNRFLEFKQYKFGWDSGCGKELSSRSVAILEYFISRLGELPTEPSLFFTREGNLQLGWEDEEGKSIEVECFPSHIEYYIEATGAEDSVALDGDELESLFKELAA